jgi:CDP-diacylglycerol--glycerol-3-phosphate 3-phosphatidyltransferase
MEALGNIVRTLARPPGRVLARLGVPPDAITLFGTLANVAVGVLIGFDRLGPWLTGALILATGFIDAIDGTVARMTGKVTAFGGLLDSVTDRISDAAVLLGLLVAYQHRGNELAVSFCGAALATFPLVSYVRGKAENLGLDVKGGIMTRTLRILALGVSFFARVDVPVIGVLAGWSLVTAIDRILIVRRELAKR